MVYKKRLQNIKKSIEKVRKTDFYDINSWNDFDKLVHNHDVYEKFYNEIVNELEGLKL